MHRRHCLMRTSPVMKTFSMAMKGITMEMIQMKNHNMTTMTLTQEKVVFHSVESVF